MAESDSAAAARTEQAIAIADDVFPAFFEDELPFHIGVPMALLARCVSIAKTSLHLSQLDTRLDALVCLRTLYEHTVMLAWLLGSEKGEVERERRLLLWERYCDEQVTRLDREMTADTGVSGLATSAAEAIKEAAAVSLDGGRIPGLADRAKLADRDWDDRVKLIDPGRQVLWSLRDSYTRFYRPASAMAHPTLSSVKFVTSRRPGLSAIHLERSAAGPPVLPAVPAFLAMAYLTTAHFVEEPALEKVEVLVHSLRADADPWYS